MRNTAGIVVSLALAFVLLCVFSVDGGAASPGPGNDGLDVVILIDQSQSMSGPNKNGDPPSDPSQHRLALAKQLLVLFAINASDTGAVHHVSVMDFGTDPHVLLHDMTLERDATNPLQCVRDVSLRAGAIMARNLVFTDTPTALAAAAKELDTLRGPNAGRRQRAIVMLTDGRPDRQKLGAAVSESVAMLDGMRGLLSRDTKPLLMKAGIPLWVIGLDASGAFWNKPLGSLEPDGPFWTRFAGGPDHALRAENSFPEVIRAGQHVLDMLLGSKGVPLDREAYKALPYLRRLLFTVQYPQPRGPVAILDPFKTPIAPLAGAAANENDVFSAFMLEDPEPGDYFVGAPDPKAIDVVVHASGPAVRLESLPQVFRDMPTVLTVALDGARAGTRIAIDPAKGVIDGTFHISGSSGSTDVPFRAQADGRLLADWTPKDPGPHTIDVVARVSTAQGQSEDLFRGEKPAALTVDVTRFPPVVLVLDDPADPAQARILPPQRDLPLRFHLAEGANGPVANPESMVRDPGHWLSVVPIDANGQEIAPPVAAQFADGVFSVRLPIAFDYPRGEGWLTVRRLAFRAVTATPLLEGRTLAGLVRSQSVITARVNGDPLTLDGLCVRYPLWLTYLAAGLLLASGLLLVGGLAVWQYPRQRIQFADRTRGAALNLRFYDQARGPNSGKTIPVTGVFARRWRDLLQIQQGNRRFRVTRIEYRRRDRSNESPNAALRYQIEGDAQVYQQFVHCNGDPRPLRGGPGEAGWVVALTSTKLSAPKKA